MANFYGQYVGFGAGGAVAPSSPAAGNINSYQSGGTSGVNHITMFTLASHGNTEDVGDLAIDQGYASGHSSTTDGFTSCDYYPATNVINRFSFPSASTSVDHADTNWTAYVCGGSSGTTNGYIWGGVSNDRLQRFEYASTGTGTDVGDIADGNRRVQQCADSATASYCMGGGEPNKTSVQQRTYASDGDSTGVGTCNSSSEIIGPCANSMTHCYVAGGGETPRTKNIDEMSFASGGTCNNAGDLSNNNQFGSGSSSKAGFAYVAGGNTSSGVTDDIEQYAMVSSTTASDVGHLVAPRSGANMANMNGHQY